MKKIALTGSTGFIGKHLLKKLVALYGKENILVVASEKNPEIDTIIYDKSTKKWQDDSLINAEVLIHAGAYTPKSGTEANNVEACYSNIEFTTDLLKKNNIKVCRKIINISTLDVYSFSEKINEQTNVDSPTLYGASKLYCEKIVSSYANQNNISHINLRLGHIFGIGEEAYQKIIPITIKKVLKAEPVEIYGDGLAVRSFLSVQDVVTSIINAVEKKIEVPVINVVSENAITINDLVKKINSYSDTPSEIKYIKSEIPNKNFVFDATLLKKYLLPEETAFDVVLKEEFNYMKKL